MPRGVPVATFAIGEAGATNAALFAVALLALDDPRLADELRRSATTPRPPLPPACSPPRDHAAGNTRHPRGRPARPLLRDRGAHDGLPHDGAGARSGSPAGAVADEHLVAAYDDPAALDRLAAECAVVTTEFENPPAAALEWLQRSPGAPVAACHRHRPGPPQEKRFLAAAGIPVAPFDGDRRRTRIDVAGRPPFPAILKTARLGYDGKGQVTVASPASWPLRGSARQQPCVLEERVGLDGEVSVIIARSSAGERDGLPAVRQHPCRRDPRLHRRPGPSCRRPTPSPSRSSSRSTTSACSRSRCSSRRDGVLVNELAPRPHNSGHWTLDRASRASSSSRCAPCAVCARRPVAVRRGGGDGQRARRRVGRRRARLGCSARPPGCAEAAPVRQGVARPGRKMGHITVDGADARPRRWRSARAIWPSTGRLTSSLPESSPSRCRARRRFTDSAARSTSTSLRPLVVPRRRRRDRPRPIGHPDRAERDGGDHRRRRHRHRHRAVPLWLLILVAAGGAFLGDNIAYLIGRRSADGSTGVPSASRSSPARCEGARADPQRGGLLLITARFLPGGRTMLTLTCGATRQNHRWFMAGTARRAHLGDVLGGLAYVVGEPLEDHESLAFWAAFGAASSVNVVIEVVRKVRDRGTTKRLVAGRRRRRAVESLVKRGTSPSSTSPRCGPRWTIR